MDLNCKQCGTTPERLYIPPGSSWTMGQVPNWYCKPCFDVVTKPLIPAGAAVEYVQPSMLQRLWWTIRDRVRHAYHAITGKSCDYEGYSW